MSTSTAAKYTVKIVREDTYGDAVYQVFNDKGDKVNVEWATYEGATACAELLEEGHLRE